MRYGKCENCYIFACGSVHFIRPGNVFAMSLTEVDKDLLLKEIKEIQSTLSFGDNANLETDFDKDGDEEFPEEIDNKDLENINNTGNCIFHFLILF